MQRIDGGYLYELGDAVRSVAKFKGIESPAYEVWGALMTARAKVSEFLHQSVYASSLRGVHPSATNFIAAIDALVARIHQEKIQNVTAIDMVYLSAAYDKFEPVLVSELSTAVTYLAQPKGAYDVSSLIEAGERMFPESIQSKAPDAVSDIQQGCKALAFELWTAAAFHWHRANEAVLRRYFDFVAGEQNRPKVRTMGTMLAELTRLDKGDKDVIAGLKNIVQFHRNPIIHPGEFIETADEALSLVSAIRASVGYMLDRLPPISMAELLTHVPPPPTALELIADATTEQRA